jgi:hypothetical protein
VYSQARYRLRRQSSPRGFLVDEMKPCAGETADGHKRNWARPPARSSEGWAFVQPWTSEKDMSAHSGNMPKVRGGSPSHVCAVGAVLAGGKCGREAGE